MHRHGEDHRNTQVKSNRPLTDAESVDAAIPIDEELWDSYFEVNDCLAVARKLRGYLYRLDDAIASLYEFVSMIYRKYCGSLKIVCGEMIMEVESQVLADMMIIDTDREVHVSAF